MTREELVEKIAEQLYIVEHAHKPGSKFANETGSMRKYWLTSATEVFKAISTLGLAIVPVEATEEMLSAYMTAQAIPIPEHRRHAHRIKAKRRYKAMISAGRVDKEN